MLSSLLIMVVLTALGAYLNHKIRSHQETKEKEARERMEAIVEEEMQERIQRDLEDKYRE